MKDFNRNTVDPEKQASSWWYGSGRDQVQSWRLSEHLRETRTRLLRKAEVLRLQGSAHQCFTTFGGVDVSLLAHLTSRVESRRWYTGRSSIP